MRAAFAGVGMVCVALLPACSDLNVISRAIGPNSALITQADTRVIFTTPARLDAYGKNRPTQISCAEPSPDIAKTMDAAFGAGVTGKFAGGQPTAEQAAQIAGAFSSSRAEAAAQLGERIASIQLLRDGLFRACEAYQNGALSPISYALVLSRYGDTMVTLLGSELIAGEFGRKGASTSGNAAGSANASTGEGPVDPAKEKAVTEARNSLADAMSTEAKNQNAVDNLNDSLTAAAGDEKKSADVKSQIKDAEKTLKDSHAETKKAQDKLAIAIDAADSAKSAAARSEASAAGTGIGGLQPTQTTQSINRITDIVRDYMHAPTVHSIMTACIAALEDNDRGNTALGTFCIENMPVFVAVLGDGYRKSIEGVAATTVDTEFRLFADRIRRLETVLGRVKSAVTPKSSADTARQAAVRRARAAEKARAADQARNAAPAPSAPPPEAKPSPGAAPMKPGG